MNTIWILVAKADQAKLFTLEHQPRKLVLKQQFDHPESRLKKHELVENEIPNHGPNGAPRGKATYHSNPRRDEQTEFAKQLARFLDNGRNHQQFDELIIIADPGFHGFLNAEMNKHLSAMTSRHIQKNYTDLAEDKLLDIVLAKPEYA